MQNTLCFSLCALCAALFVSPSKSQIKASKPSLDTQINALSGAASIAFGSAGYVAFEGEGVIVTLSDRRPTGTKTHPVPPPYSAFVHDFHVAMLINELRSAGADAIAVNGVRLTAQTGIRERGPVLLVGDKPIKLPVRIEAIGGAVQMRDTLKRQGGFVGRMRESGPRVEVVTSPKILLAAPPLPETPSPAPTVGLVVRLSDREGVVAKLPHTPKSPPPNFVFGWVHDFDVQAVVDGLRAAGATRITVNGILLSKAASIKCVGPNLLIGTQKVSVPVRVEAIGNARTLVAKLKTKGGAVEKMRQSGVRIELSPATQLSSPLASS